MNTNYMYKRAEDIEVPEATSPIKAVLYGLLGAGAGVPAGRAVDKRFVQKPFETLKKRIEGGVARRTSGAEERLAAILKPLRSAADNAGVVLDDAKRVFAQAQARPDLYANSFNVMGDWLRNETNLTPEAKAAITEELKRLTPGRKLDAAEKAFKDAKGAFDAASKAGRDRITGHSIKADKMLKAIASKFGRLSAGARFGIPAALGLGGAVYGYGGRGTRTIQVPDAPEPMDWKALARDPRSQLVAGLIGAGALGLGAGKLFSKKKPKRKGRVIGVPDANPVKSDDAATPIMA